MGRRAETPGKPASNRIDVLVSDEVRDWLDGRRGHTSRSKFIRTLLIDQRATDAGSDQTAAPDPNQPELPLTDCAHRWVKLSSAFDGCSTCEARRPHQVGTR